MPLADLSEETIRLALKRYEGLFSAGDVEAILEDFTEDVRVRYGAYAPFQGKSALRAMLRLRFSNMRDYKLVKKLEFVAPPRIASSWTGSWLDVATNVELSLFGVELLTVRDGRFSEWSASVSTWKAGTAPQVPR